MEASLSSNAEVLRVLASLLLIPGDLTASLSFKIPRGGLPWWSWWVRLGLPMQGVWVPSLVPKIPHASRPENQNIKKKKRIRASLVAQRLRIHLPIQETGVRSLIHEDPTCQGATKPMPHNYWASAPEPGSHKYCAHVLQRLKPAHPRACTPQQEKPPQMRNVCTAAREEPLLLGKACAATRPSTAKNK